MGMTPATDLALNPAANSALNPLDPLDPTAEVGRGVYHGPEPNC